MERIIQDIRFALRKLRRSPGFTAAAIVTLALGIGANTTIFSLVNAILLRPPAHVVEPARLVALYTSDYSGPAFGGSSYPDYLDIRKQSDVFDGVMLYVPRSVGIGEGDEMESAGLELVSENYFSVLGVRPRAGRFFLPEEGVTPGANAVAVISHGLWQRRFGGREGVVGSTIQLNARPYTVVGIAPSGFAGSLRGLSVDVWVPAVMGTHLGVGSDVAARGNRGSMMMARLRDGVTIEQAATRMSVLARQLLAAYPDYWTDVSKQGRRISVLAEREARVPPQIRGPALGFVALLMATVGIVLLICCANVASLMLARAAGRAREIGIRLSLGASRGRIVRQMLTESVVLAALGAVLGGLLALWATSALMSFQPPVPVRIALDLRPDGLVLTFTALVAVATGVLFGLAPALRASRPDLVTVLKSEVAGVRLGRRRLSLQSALVVSQVAMSMLLLTGALLFMRTLRGAALIDPGFRTENLLLISAGPKPGIEDGPTSAEVGLELQRRIGGLPGVRAVSWAASVPLGLGSSRRSLTIEKYRPRDGEDMEYHFNVVGPRYFETMEVPLVRGRGFTEADREGAPPAIVVNEAFARRFWPGEDALGKRVSWSGETGPFAEVIGVAKDGRYLSLAEAARPYVFMPALLVDDGVILHVRTAGDPRALTAAVRREVEAAAPGWMASDPRTLEEHVGNSLLPQRIAGAMLGLFSGVALVLAAVGLYGVVAYAVAQRTREIGVRIALGARREDVVRMVLRQGALLVGIGAAIGLPLAWAASRLISGFLLGVGAGDPMTFLAAAVVLGLVALLASYLPARRASRVDPMVALRVE